MNSLSSHCQFITSIHRNNYSSMRRGVPISWTVFEGIYIYIYLFGDATCLHNASRDKTRDKSREGLRCGFRVSVSAFRLLESCASHFATAMRTTATMAMTANYSVDWLPASYVARLIRSSNGEHNGRTNENAGKAGRR